MSLPGLTFNKIHLSAFQISKSCQWTYTIMESDWNVE